MTRKSTAKTSKSVVKNTKTDNDAESTNVVKNTKIDAKIDPKLSEIAKIKHNEQPDIVDSPRWYHFTALIAVLILAGFAVYKLINRYDVSILGASHTVDIYHGCDAVNPDEPTDDSDRKYRSYGLREGDMFGKDGLTSNEEEAYVRIIKFEGDYAVVSRHSDDNDWAERTVDYGVIQSVYLYQNDESCVESLVFTIR